MSFVVDLQWFLAVLLATARLSALLLFSPLLTLVPLPGLIRIVMLMVFGAGIVAVVGTPAVTFSGSATLVAALLRELAIGALMAFGLLCAFGALLFGGRLLDLQMGFGVANLVDPGTREQAPLLGTLLLLVGLMTFFLLDVHHWFAQGVVQSFRWFPLGDPWPPFALQPLVAQFGLMFSLGFMVVAPVVAVLLLLDLAIALAARSMPQMNVFMLSIPIKIAVGLLALAACSVYLQPLFNRLFESIFLYWRSLA